MTHHIDLLTAPAIVLASVTAYVSQGLLATAGSGWLPENIEKLGIVALLSLGIIWFARKMEAAEKREEKMQDAHMVLLTQMAEAHVKTAEALERNSIVLDRVEKHLTKRDE